ncbi:MAG: DNA repair protein RadA [Bacillota bacterium]|uniref:DNA repair protein RadA n=1 Tax=Desulfurispora thermophila TaxID=265470 RepID=UPI00036A6FE4|nr:DNA repair protein RadA [Desulfurispora thermophila]
MATKTRYLCQQCGYVSARWLGRCPACNTWNSLVEEVVTDTGKKKRAIASNQAEIFLLSDVPQQAEERWLTGIGELDRVLGGGIVPGSLVLLGGDPGIGKSTLLLQVAGELAGRNLPVLYASGEESARQVAMRARRLGIDGRIYLLAQNDLDNILHHVRQLSPAVLIIDSIQAVYRPALESAPGSVGQVRECAVQVMHLAKQEQVAVFLVGHVTKEGALAGPRVLEHMVDTVLYFEGERHQTYRILRSVKNRFGSTNEIGIFQMHQQGLVEVDNPSALFLLEHPQGSVPGAVVTATLEGTRPLLVELQALVCHSGYGTPRRMTAGLDYNRVALIMAVLEKRLGLQLGGLDAYVNAVGGVRLGEPGVDLAVALALASSYRERPVSRKVVAVGEIGLTGEIRPVVGVEQRVREAARLGFTQFLLPAAADLERIKGETSLVQVFPVFSLGEALEIALAAG